MIEIICYRNICYVVCDALDGNSKASGLLKVFIDDICSYLILDRKVVFKGTVLANNKDRSTNCMTEK